MPPPLQITPEDDPREAEDDFDTPPIGGPGPPIFTHGRHRPEVESDPEEADIEEHTFGQPGGVFVRQTIYRSPSRPQGGPGGGGGGGGGGGSSRRPVDPSNGDAILQRFTEMLMNDFRAGQPGRSGPDTLFPPDDDGFLFPGAAPGQFRRTTFTGPRLSGGTAHFTIATTPLAPHGPGGAHQGPGGFEAYAASRPRRLPAVAMITYRTSANPHPRVFSNLMGGIPPPPARDASDPGGGGAADGHGLPPGFPAGLHQLLAHLLNPATAVQGDAVYSQEALDRIISALMEANPQSNAAPPASQSAIDKLERKQVDDQMLGPEGRAECTICISEVTRGEQVVSLPCKHWFHDECVVMWLKEHNTCPVCRNPIEGGGGEGSAGARNEGGHPMSPPPPPNMARSAPASPVPASGPTLAGLYRRRERPERAPRSPAENEERLNSIRNLAGMSGQRGSTRDRDRDRDNRRSSYSPVSPRAQSASEHGSRARQRSPSPGLRRRPSDRERSPHHRGGSSSHGLWGFIRDQFHRNPGHGSSGGRRRS